MEDLKTIEFLLTEDDQIKGDIDIVSIVQNPATELSFQLFGKQNLKYKFQEEGEQRIITGCIMRPNLKILRLDATGEPYYCWFSEDTVRLAAQLYFKCKNNSKTNLEHSNYEINRGIYAFESWIVEDETRDKALALGFEDVKKGDWYGSFKIEDESLWKFLKTHYNNGTAGFSLEGFFIQNEAFAALSTDEQLYNKIKAIIELEGSDELKYNELAKIIGTNNK
jgi:hypothetical protein